MRHFCPSPRVSVVLVAQSNRIMSRDLSTGVKFGYIFSASVVLLYAPKLHD